MLGEEIVAFDGVLGRWTTTFSVVANQILHFDCRLGRLAVGLGLAHETYRVFDPLRLLTVILSIPCAVVLVL